MNGEQAAARYVTLDFYRFVAAFLVVLYHYSAYVDLAWAPSAVAGFGYCVDFFFILSGYIICHSYSKKVNDIDEYFDFIWRRLSRVYPLHLLCLAFYCVILIAAGLLGLPASDPSRYTLSAVPFQLTLTQVWGVDYGLTFNYPAWSISAEWFLYLTFPALLATARFSVPTAFAIAALWIGACVALIELGHFPEWDRWVGPFALLRALPSFLLGIAICRLIEGRDLKMSSLASGLLTFAISILLIIGGAPAPVVLAGFALAVAFTAMAERNRATSIFSGGACQKLGNTSYALYMIHAPVATIVLQMIGLRILRLSGVEMLWFALATALVLIPIAGLVYVCFEWPARRALNAMSSAGRLASKMQKR